MNQQIDIQFLLSSQTWPLRHAVLRPDQPIETAMLPHDDDPATFHLGAVIAGEIVGVASLYQEALPHNTTYDEHVACDEITTSPELIWRLRGMAVDPLHQRQGIGLALLHFAISEITNRGGTLLWCNARIGALGFYRIAGFVVCSDEFVIPDVGPHFVMARPLR